jgi:hypothetical protein
VSFVYNRVALVEHLHQLHSKIKNTSYGYLIFPRINVNLRLVQFDTLSNQNDNTPDCLWCYSSFADECETISVSVLTVLEL